MTRQKTVAIIAVAMSNLLVMLALTPVSAILPSIALSFDVDVTTASWVLTSFLLTLTSFQLTAGRLGDLYGHRKVFLLGAILYTVLGTACAVANDIGLLITLRALQGIGAGMIAGNSLAIVAHMFTAKERGIAIGIGGTAASTGALLGVGLSALLAQYQSWQLLFYLTLPLGLIAIKFAFDLVVDFRPTEAPRLDILGALLLAVVITMFSLSLSHLHGGEASFTGGWEYHGGLLITCGVALLLFVIVEMRAPQPIVDLRYLLNGPFIASITANEILHMTMMASTFLMPFLLERGMGLPPVYTAGMIVVTQLGNMAAAPISGMLYDRTRWKFLCPGAMVAICSGLGLMAVFGPTIGYIPLLVVGFCLGIGLGFFMTPNNTIIMGSVPANLRGFAAGMLETSRQLGHTLGVGAASAVLGIALASSAPRTSLGSAYIFGFQEATLASTAIAFLGILAALVYALSRTSAHDRPLEAVETV